MTTLTCVYQVSASADDAGSVPPYLSPNGCTYDTTTGNIYFGECGNSDPITSGFRFTIDTLTPSARIAQAYLDFTVDGPYTDTLALTIVGEHSLNPAAFSTSSSPSSRTATSASAAWSIPQADRWELGEHRSTPDLTGVVREILGQSGWQSGNALVLLVKKAGPASGVSRHRRVIGYDRDPSAAARLVIKLDGALSPEQVLANEGCNCHKPAPNPSTHEPVNLRTGNFWTQVTDLHVETPGPTLIWQRTYASQGTGFLTGTLGIGWQHLYGAHLITPSMPDGVAGSLFVVSGVGNKLRFFQQLDGSYEPALGIYDTLTVNSSTITQTLPDQTQRLFDASTGRLTGLRDPHGRTLTLSYSGTPVQLDRIEDADDSNRFLALTYTSAGQIETVSDGVRSVTYGYTGDDLTSVQDVMQRTTSYSYTNHLLTAITDPLGTPVEQMVYDAYTPAGKVTQQTLRDGRELSFIYTTNRTTLVTQGADGSVSAEAYDFDGRNALTAVSRNGADVFASSFDAGFSPGAVSDGNGHQTTTQYTTSGLPLTVTNALGQMTTTQYDSARRPLATTDAGGITTRWRYDALGNVLSTTVGIATSSAVQATTLYTYSYDVRFAGDTQLLEQSTPDGVVTRYTYTSGGQVETVTTGYGTADALTTRYAYDSLGRVNAVTTGDGTALARTDETTYNADNTIAATIQNKLDGVYDPASPDEDIVTTYGYDVLGRTVAVTNTLGQVSTTHYNTEGRVDWTARNLDPLQFDSQGQPVFQDFAASTSDRNVATLYGFDGLGRTVLVTETGILTGTFDTTARTFSDSAIRVTRTEYDALSRPVTTTLNYHSDLPIGAEPDVNVQTLSYYDGAGNPIWQRDALGRWIKTEYDALNRPITVTLNYENGDPLTVDPANAAGTDGHDTDLVQVTQYDASGRVVATIDNYVDGLFTATEPITDRITLYTYDTLGRGVSTTVNADPNTLGTRTDTNRTTATQYDSVTGRLVGRQDALGRWASTTYDASGRVLATVQNCTDTSGQPLATGCAAFDADYPDRNVATTTQYDLLGRVYGTVDVLGHVTRSEFDRLDRPTATIQHYDDGSFDPAAPDTDVRTALTLDGLGRTVGTTNAVGETTASSYNALGLPTHVTDAANRETQFGYDGLGMERWQLRPDGQLTFSELDGFGRVIATIVNYEDGQVASNEPVDQDVTTRTTYDAGGRQRLLIAPDGTTKRLVYDLRDQLVQVVENVAPATGCVRTPCDVTTTYSYDRAGNRVAITDANNHMRTFAYDAANQQVRATDALNQTTSWHYDAGGRVTQQDDPRGTGDSLTYAYDGLDRRTGVSTPNLDTITTQYDALGRRTALVDGIGTTSFAYDALGRVTDVEEPYTGHVGYSYDGAGRRTALTYPNWRKIDYAYTPAGEMQTVSENGTPFVSYTYDQAGRPFTETRANGTVITRTYDLADRLQDLHAVANGATLSQFQYTLDRNGQRTGVAETLLAPPTGSGTGLEGTYFSDTTFGTAVLTRTDATIDFDWGDGAPDSTVPSDQFSVRWTGMIVPRYSETYTFSTFSDDGVKLEVDGTTVINDMTPHGPTGFDGTIALTAGQAYTITLDYFEDVGGAMAQLRWESPSQPREIIPTSQLYPPGATIGSQGTTPIVQTRAITYTYDGLQRLTGADTAGGMSYQYAYDDAGNRTDVWVNSALVSHQTYNAANQVDGWTYDAVGNLLNDGTTNYTYDTLNRLRRMAAPAAQSFYDYNGDGVLIARGVNSNFTRFSQDLALPLPQILQTSWSSDDTFIYGRDRFAMTNTWGRSWYSTDGIGSVRQTANDSGLPLSVGSYDPWGMPEHRSNGIFGFTGELQEPNKGHVYLRTRWYNSTNGSFVSRDSFMGFEELPYSLHSYQYGYSNPLSYKDPSGKCAAGDGDNISNCQKREKELFGYGLKIEKLEDWKLAEIGNTVLAVKDLLKASNWSPSRFKSIITGGAAEIILRRNSSLGGSGYAYPDYILLEKGAIGIHYEMQGRSTIIHELAHVWDFKQDMALSQGMMRATGSKWVFTGCQWIFPCVFNTPDWVYEPGGCPASKYAHKSPEEDWAEAVAAAAEPMRDASERYKPDEQRKKYVQDMFKKFR